MAEPTITVATSGHVTLSPSNASNIFFDTPVGGKGGTLFVPGGDISITGSSGSIGGLVENFQTDDTIIVEGLGTLIPSSDLPFLETVLGELGATLELTVSPTGVITTGSSNPLATELAGLISPYVGDVDEALFGTESPGVTLFVDINADPTNVVDITVTANGLVTCYAPGTRIATPDGDAAVEDITQGDLVLTADGNPVPVAWTGSWEADLDASEKPETLRPVRVAAGALGHDLPKRDLYVSPDHSFYLDGVLVPARLLLNGTTITQPEIGGRVTYHHVEIEPHGVLLAEGAPAESFLDLGTTMFSRADAEPKSWEDACAPIVVAGEQLEEIRSKLAKLPEMV